jgi:hypothetical protein
VTFFVTVGRLLLRVMLAVKVMVSPFAALLIAFWSCDELATSKLAAFA